MHAGGPSADDTIAPLYAPGRPYLGIPEPPCPFHDRTVVVTGCGRLCLYKTSLPVQQEGQSQHIPRRPGRRCPRKWTTASGWSVLWITISAILIWRKKLC